MELRFAAERVLENMERSTLVRDSIIANVRVSLSPLSTVEDEV
jgi:hypothetical protein